MKHTERFTGRIGVLEDIRELPNGNCVVNFSVAETPRVKQGDKWEDGPTIWTNVSIFGDEARNLHRSVKPGTFVTVIGERKARDYTTKENEKRTVQSVVAEQVSIAITKFNYVEGIGNVNYSKDGTNVPSKPADNTQAPEDPFAKGNDGLAEDPFSENDDPFGLTK